MIYWRLHWVGGILMQLHAMARIGHFSTGNDKTLAFIEYEHIFLLKKLMADGL
jgi:hypothetical protein